MSCAFLAVEMLFHVPDATQQQFLQNCLVALPQWLCVAGNVSGYVSSAIWSVVLFPQLLHNARRRSIVGVSRFWAVANFVASLANAFFVLHSVLPLFSHISAAYMVVFNAGLVLQFWWYQVHAHPVFWGMLLGISAAIVLVGVACPSASPVMMWVAIALWSVELLPQVQPCTRMIKLQGRSPRLELEYTFARQGPPANQPLLPPASSP